MPLDLAALSTREIVALARQDRPMPTNAAMVAVQVAQDQRLIEELAARLEIAAALKGAANG